MTSEKYRDQQIQQKLYEHLDPTNPVRDMLSHWDANSRNNSEMAQLCFMSESITNLFKGKYKERFANMSERIFILYTDMSGYSRQQAIEMQGRKTLAEQQALPEKKGILGLLKK